MESIEFNAGGASRRLRWVMLGVILFNLVLSICGQPASYWHHPETADEGNRLFHFFMVLGPAAWLAFEVVYVAVAFAVASLACGTGALIGIFAYIFGHYFGACTGLVFHWHLGAASFVIYGIVLACIIGAVMFPQPPVPVSPGAGRP